MYTQGLLLVAGILLLVILGRREHLAFTSTIKDIRRNTDTAEQERIFAMAPASLQQRANALVTEKKIPADRTKAFVAVPVADFQTEVYVAATGPITETMVDTYVAQAIPKWRNLATAYANHPESGPAFSFILETYTNGEAKQLLMTYLGLTSTSTTPVTATATATATDLTLARALELFRDNLLEYKVTGNTAYKSAADGAKGWLDRYIATMNTEITKTADSISSQVSSYSTANADLTQTQADFQRVKTEGPAAEDTYLTNRKQLGNQPVVSDSSTYIKGGVAIGLVVGAIVLALL
jgi:hypothetical protein